MKRRAAQDRGFTLVELMVSLVAGLIIAMAVIALAKTATNTFHEQVRIAATEATLRTASERLRNDLTRVAFMGTGNAALDPTIARSSAATLAVRYPSMANLQGIRIFYEGSPGAANDIMKKNGMRPDALEITGNLSTDDAYRMQWVVNGRCGGPLLQMSELADAALLRLVGGPTTTPAQRDALVKAAFTPGLALPAPVAGLRYWARAMDDRGCFHYVEICDSGYTAGTGVWVDIQQSTSDQGILQPNETNDNCGGSPLSTEFSVSPLTRVRWSVGPYPAAAPAVPAVGAALAPEAFVETANDKMYLMREVLDAMTPAGAPVAAPEIIAEYAADLKLGVVVRNPTTGAATVFDMDPSGNGPQAQTTPTATPNAAGPQRVRAVRYRITARSALPERRTNMNIFAVPNPSNAPYIVRYCLDNVDVNTSCTRFARARSLVSEVTLTNQARFNY